MYIPHLANGKLLVLIRLMKMTALISQNSEMYNSLSSGLLHLSPYCYVHILHG